MLTLGDGVLGALPEVCRSVISTPAPMASTASAVADRHHQRTAIPGVVRRAEHLGLGGATSTLARGRDEVRPPGGTSSYSPGRIGMMPESSSASDQASAGAAAGSIGISDMVVASLTDPSAVGASAVAPSPGPRAARSAAPTAAVRCGRGAEMTSAPDCSDNVLVTNGMLAPPPTDATAAKSPQTNSVALQHFMEEADEAVQRLPDRVLEVVPGQPDLALIAGHLGGQRGRIRRRELLFRVAACGTQLLQRTDRRRGRRVERSRRRRGRRRRGSTAPGRSGRRRTRCTARPG